MIPFQLRFGERLFLYFVLVVLFNYGCKNHEDSPSEKRTKANMSLIQTDVAFSALSKSKGMRESYMEYLDSNATILRVGHLPIEGADVIDYLIQQDDASVSYSWDPHHGEVAESGELGYTYGVYLMQSRESQETIYGTYMSVWRKQSDGKWKLLIQSANEGVDDSNDIIK